MQQRKRNRYRSIVPSNSLRGHFFALARQIRLWSESNADLSVNGTISVGVTSLERGVGSSTVSFNLTCALASLCRARTLLIESDFGHPFIAARLGHSKAPGLSELLGWRDDGTRIHFCDTHCGCICDWMWSKNLTTKHWNCPLMGLEPMLKETFAEYAYTVFDLPLASDLTACHSIAPYMDGVILTVDSNFIDQRRVTRFKKQIEAYGVPVLGIVLNKS